MLYDARCINKEAMPASDWRDRGWAIAFVHTVRSDEAEFEYLSHYLSVPMMIHLVCWHSFVHIISD